MNSKMDFSVTNDVINPEVEEKSKDYGEKKIKVALRKIN